MILRPRVSQMTKYNYNQNMQNCTINNKNILFEDLSVSVLDLLSEKINNNQPLVMWRNKAIPKTQFIDEFLKDLWKKEIGVNLESQKVKKLSNLIDAYIQYLFSNKVRHHYIQPEIKKIKKLSIKDTGRAIKRYVTKNTITNQLFINNISGTHEPTCIEETVLAISQDFTKRFANNGGLKLKNSEIALIHKMLLVEVQKSCYQQNFKVAENEANNNTNNQLFINSISGTHEPTCSNDKEFAYSTFSKGYRINKEFIKFWQKLKNSDGNIENKINATYNLIKSSIDKNQQIYSFNRDENFVLDFASGRKIEISSIKIDENNCDNLKTDDLIFNQIDFNGFNIDSIITKLIKKHNRLASDVLKKRRSFNKAQHLKLQIQYVLGMMEFIKEYGYWIDLYRVAENGRLYAQGISFQNISKEIRKIVFNITKNSDINEVDQTAAQLHCLVAISEDCESKSILENHLNNTKSSDEEKIQIECGIGKKAWKTKRNCALNGFIHLYDKIQKSETGMKLLIAIKDLAAKVDVKNIIKEERRRTFEIIGNSTILVWLHDGAIIKK